MSSFPYKIGYDAAGTVEQTGTGVIRVKVGDAVYVRLPESHRGIGFTLQFSSALINFFKVHGVNMLYVRSALSL
jgi:NADPH:quinone reductase-like Zn-dependent oxidoreductase